MDICRLCCSTKFVSNNIFDEENALYLKMSLYLPIKIYQDDGLPNKICDKCSCKVNDFYQFCNETIEVQNRLRTLLLSRVNTDVTVDLTRVKENASPTQEVEKCEQSCERSTQTDFDKPPETPQPQVQVKQEPAYLSPVKEEFYNDDVDGTFSDDDNVSLISLKKKKKDLNGVEKRSKKKKGKLKEWNMLMNVLPQDTTVEVNGDNRDETKKFNLSIEVKNIKSEMADLEMNVYNCCVCHMQCFSRTEMLQHYKSHVKDVSTSLELPPPPPPPDKEPLRCMRCNKMMSREEWGPHWARHWDRDRRPYRCGLCEKAFRDPYQIFKHGLTHKAGESTNQPTMAPRFVCDLCPEQFVYMRCLSAHRTLAHPEARTRPLALRCGQCGRSFAHLNSLRRHLRSHSGERNFLCNVCGKALTSREHLKFHIRIHTGDKPNVCGVCGKGFVKKCNLTLHERVHSGEKPHVCSHCGKAFSQRSTLVIHERYHSGARPYRCEMCGRGFVAKGLLSMHLKSTCI